MSEALIELPGTHGIRKIPPEVMNDLLIYLKPSRFIRGDLVLHDPVPGPVLRLITKLILCGKPEPEIVIIGHPAFTTHSTQFIKALAARHRSVHGHAIILDHLGGNAA